MKKYILFIALNLLFSSVFFAQKNGYKIQIKIEKLTAPFLYLGFYNSSAERLQLDSAKATNGAATFEGTEKLPAGMYLVFDKTDTTFFNFLIDKEQYFSIFTKKDSLYNALKAENSADNSLYFEEIKIAENARYQIFALENLIKNLQRNDKLGNQNLEQEIRQIADSSLQRQTQLLATSPPSFAHTIFWASQELKIPDSLNNYGDRLLFFKNHYFDNLDLNDERLHRTPFYMSRIENYINKLGSFHPDSLRNVTAFVLQKIDKKSIGFKLVSTRLLNYFGKSELALYEVGYVKVVEDYLDKGEMPWITGEDSVKISKTARNLKSSLVGNIAPDLKMQQRDSSEISLSEVAARYILLIFWDPDCKVCHKKIPALEAVYEKYQPLGLEAFAVCTRQGNSFVRCWETADADNMRWITVADPLQKSNFMTLYNTSNLPMIYVLNGEKKIIAKKIKAERLDAYLATLFGNTKK